MLKVNIYALGVHFTLSGKGMTLLTKLTMVTIMRVRIFRGCVSYNHIQILTGTSFTEHTLVGASRYLQSDLKS